MIKRTLELSNSAFLSVSHNQLCVEQNKLITASIPFEDIGSIIFNHPAIVVTHAVLQHCSVNNVALISCDKSHMPSYVALPLWGGNTLHAKVLKTQISASDDLRGRIWKEFISEKIAQQAETLRLAGKNHLILERYSKEVLNADRNNLEATSARVYWPRLMGKQFKRNSDAEDVNKLLNYGYSILRSAVARAIVSSGLHPSLGIHHSNKYNHFNLADDLMEPFRPWVDEEVWRMDAQGIDCLSIESKRRLLKVLSQDCLFGNHKMPFEVALPWTVSCFKKRLSKEAKKMCFPQRICHA